MRKNLPITNKEVVAKDDALLISKTDLKGIITYASPDFVELSGFPEDELLGQPHNILRHPDMPIPVFKDLWEHLKNDRAWTGLVKNRCKNGDHYWVHAEVSSVRENDKVVGYMSVRYKPSIEQIVEAEEFYKRINAGKINFSRIASKQELSLKDRVAYIGLLTVVLIMSLTGLFFLLFNQVSEAVDSEHNLITARNNINQSITAQENAWKKIIADPGNKTVIEENKKIFLEKRDETKERIDYIANIIIEHAEGDAEATKQINEVGKAYDDYLHNRTNLLKILENRGPADLELDTNLEENLRRSLGEKITIIAEDASESVNETIKASFKLYRWVVLAAGGGGLFLILLLTWFLMENIKGTMRRMALVATRIASGDLTTTVKMQLGGEVGHLVDAIKAMGINLRGLISQIQDESENSADSARKLSEHTSRLTNAAREQVAATEEASASVEELTSASEHIVKIVQQQSQNVAENRGNSQAMQESMQQVSEGMTELKDLAKESSERAQEGEKTIGIAVEATNEIRSRASQISAIISLITEISDQTNLLSLNAAIEAARAGEEGRGFAVVADEISRLADKTGESVKEIGKLISLTNQAIENGSKQFTIAASSFQDIANRVGLMDTKATDVVDIIHEQVKKANTVRETTMKVTQIAKEIEQAATEQKAAMIEINDHIQNISSEGQNVGHSAEDLTILVEDMTRQADFMKQVVKSFRIK
ncbi:MAG: methyl-accepting chemotaxis protein [Spirochaetia bacterium]|nr:methyl-accepting chemotaxis protein [Spirochaetia bacterium]